MDTSNYDLFRERFRLHKITHSSDFIDIKITRLLIYHLHLITRREWRERREGGWRGERRESRWGREWREWREWGNSDRWEWREGGRESRWEGRWEGRREGRWEEWATLSRLNQVISGTIYNKIE
jgi:hypothetical protein